MKVAILNDTHFGVKNSSDVFLDYQERFFSEVFFPYCIEHGITRVIHCGDVFDNRKFIPVKTLWRSRKFFFERLSELGIELDIIPGNHDVSYKNSNFLNSLEEVLPRYQDFIRIHMSPVEIELDGLVIALLPWINSENYAESMKFVRSTRAPILMGHLELQGFEMMKGAPPTTHGMAGQENLDRFDMVLSGHYHTKSTQGNVHYLGTQYELTWADCDDAKHFHVLDTGDRSLTAIRNPICIFNRVIYDDVPHEDPVQAVLDCDVSFVKGSFVKVIVASKRNPFAFDKFIDKIQASSPFDLKIVESLAEFQGDAIGDDEISLADTSSLLNTYIDGLEIDLSKDRLKSLIQELYAEAQELDAA